MSDKLVHVKSYTRDDGTKVKEHYRGGGSVDENEQSLVLQGGVSHDEPLQGNNEAVEVALVVSQIAVNLAIEGIKIASAIRCANKDKASQLCVQMEEVVEKMREAQGLSVSSEQATLEKLSNTTNQREYKELYDTYVQQRELNRASEAVLSSIAYNAEHKNYEEVVSGLKEYKSLQTHSAQSVMERANLNSQPNYLQFEDQAMPQMLPDISSDIRNSIAKGMDKTLEYVIKTGLHDYPQAQKSAIGAGMFYEANFNNAYDAKELWKAAAFDFEKSGEYIEQNGYLLDTIDGLSEPFHSIVRKKVRQQIGMYDCKGLVLMPGSTLSQEIAMSPEFKAFLREKKADLLSGKIVSGSKEFSSNENLAYALGNADIINTYIDSNGNIVSYVLDTYDFNKGDPRWEVEVAYNVQRNGLMTNFYTLNIIIIPKEQWMF